MIRSLACRCRTLSHCTYPTGGQPIPLRGGRGERCGRWFALRVGRTGVHRDVAWAPLEREWIHQPVPHVVAPAEWLVPLHLRPRSSVGARRLCTRVHTTLRARLPGPYSRPLGDEPGFESAEAGPGALTQGRVVRACRSLTRCLDLWRGVDVESCGEVGELVHVDQACPGGFDGVSDFGEQVAGLADGPVEGHGDHGEEWGDGDLGKPVPLVQEGSQESVGEGEAGTAPGVAARQRGFSAGRHRVAAVR